MVKLEWGFTWERGEYRQMWGTWEVQKKGGFSWRRANEGKSNQFPEKQFSYAFGDRRIANGNAFCSLVAPTKLLRGLREFGELSTFIDCRSMAHAF